MMDLLEIYGWNPARDQPIGSEVENVAHLEQAEARLL